MVVEKARCRSFLRPGKNMRLDVSITNRRQTIDLISAWLIAEDDGAKSKIQSLLANRNESFAIIKASLQGM